MDVLRVLLSNDASNELRNSYLCSYHELFWCGNGDKLEKSLFRIWKWMRLQASRRTIRCVNALWLIRKILFSREDLTITRTNRRSPMMWSRLPCKRSHCKHVRWKSKFEKILEKRSLRIGKRMWLQASRRTICNAMRQCIVRKIIFLEKRFLTMHTNQSTEPDDVVEAESFHTVNSEMKMKVRKKWPHTESNHGC